jgi:hypothetical protein
VEGGRRECGAWRGWGGVGLEWRGGGQEEK